MIEITLHGRGGQGGVTLAKLIATAYFLQGRWAQAFGVYAAERSGAPVQAYVRIDDAEITNRNQIREPNHVIVLDPTLIGTQVLAGVDPTGWIIVNAPEEAADWGVRFEGRRVAWVDASRIAVEHGLGTPAVPIVNTAMIGAVARVLGLGFEDVTAALDALHFGGANLAAARAAFDAVRSAHFPGRALVAPPPPPPARVATLLDDDIGAPPAIRTGLWATRTPHQRELTPPCNDTCPAGNDIRGFVAAIAGERYDEALDVLLRSNPLPGVCGRVCPAPCMTACNRNALDGAVNVRELERAAADFGQRPEPLRPWREERVVVVGSGPAGLAASFHLARLGYPVTLLEAADALGGVLRNGIPEYRLPKAVLDREIEWILDHGLTVFTNERVDRATLLRLTSKYDAVFVATGLQRARTLDLRPAGASRCEVMQGIDFLDRVHRGGIDIRGRRVVVAGGGNTAIDAARSALRLGASQVSIVYRRTRAEMPAIAEEVDAAIEEGVELRELTLPVGTDAGAITCARMKLGEPDSSGRRRPVADGDATFALGCDLLILAVGQEPDDSIVSEAELLRHGDPIFVGAGRAPLAFGGDLATGEGTVAAAIGSGARAARLIHRELTGEDLLPAGKPPVAGIEVIRLPAFAPLPPRRSAALPPEQRRRGFREVHPGLSPADANYEAARCFSCGVCTSCDVCVHHCPEGILTRERRSYLFNYDYCKGCGICGAVCPRGVIAMS